MKGFDFRINEVGETSSCKLSFNGFMFFNFLEDIICLSNFGKEVITNVRMNKIYVFLGVLGIQFLKNGKGCTRGTRIKGHLEFRIFDKLNDVEI